MPLRLSALILLASMLAPGEGVDSAWKAAAEGYARSRDWVAGSAVFLYEELDDDGSVRSRERVETLRDPATGGYRVVRAEKDGRDTTEDARKRYERGNGSGGGTSPGGGPPGSGSGKAPAGFDATPFDPAWLPFVTRGQPRRSGADTLVPYAIRKDGVDIVGTARFGPDGSALGSEQEWVDLPPFVSSMASTTRYIVNDGVLLVASMTIQGKASFLMLKRNFRMGFEFSDYRPKGADG